MWALNILFVDKFDMKQRGIRNRAASGGGTARKVGDRVVLRQGLDELEVYNGTLKAGEVAQVVTVWIGGKYKVQRLSDGKELTSFKAADLATPVYDAGGA